jgi:hypothetical protein
MLTILQSGMKVIHERLPNPSLFRVNKHYIFFSGMFLAAPLEPEEEEPEYSRFFSGRTTKVLPSLHQWLCGPCHFFL